MYLAEADLAPEREFNEIIWKSVRGPASVMPPPRRAAFVKAVPARIGGDGDDDDGEGEGEGEGLAPAGTRRR